MTVTQLERGDIVRLNSGGPDMTVSSVGPSVEVVWITEQGEALIGIFPAVCLMLIAPRETILKRQVEG